MDVIDEYDQLVCILKRLDKDGLTHMKDFIKEFERVEKKMAKTKKENPFEAMKRFEEFKQAKIKDGVTGDDLEVDCYNQMRLLHLITTDEQRRNIREIRNRKHKNNNIQDLRRKEFEKRLAETRPANETIEEYHIRRKRIKQEVDDDF
jgi:hypothetical protein